MDDNWGYVAAGYLIMALTVGGYGAWLWVRTRRARRSLPDLDG